MAKAMHDAVLTAMKSRVDTFHWRMLQLQPFHLTHQECLDLVAPKHHHELLWTAAEVADVKGNIADMPVEIPYTLDGVHRPIFDLRMRTHEGIDPPLVPRQPKWQGGSLETQMKVTNWVDWYLRQGRMSATTKFVIEQLATICDTGHQVRFIWPAVLHLTAGSDDEKVRRWVDKHGVRVTPRHMPTITPAFRKVLTETSEWCAQAVLLSEVKKMEQHQVFISYHTAYPFTLQLEETGVALTRDNLL